MVLDLPETLPDFFVGRGDQVEVAVADGVAAKPWKGGLVQEMRGGLGEGFRRSSEGEMIGEGIHVVAKEVGGGAGQVGEMMSED